MDIVTGAVHSSCSGKSPPNIFKRKNGLSLNVNMQLDKNINIYLITKKKSNRQIRHRQFSR